MNCYLLIAIENTKEKFIYFKIIYKSEISTMKKKLKNGLFFRESYFLQEDYKRNPENFKISEIERTSNLKEIHKLKEKYIEEFKEDLYPRSLFYKLRKTLDPVPDAVEIEPEKIIDSYNYSEELSLIGIGD